MEKLFLVLALASCDVQCPEKRPVPGDCIYLHLAAAGLCEGSILSQPKDKLYQVQLSFCEKTSERVQLLEVKDGPWLEKRNCYPVDMPEKTK